MVKVLRISKAGDFERAIDSLKRMRKRLPEMSSEIMMTWGKTLEKDVKRSAVSAGIQSHTGELLKNGIEYRQRPNGRIGHLFIRDYGVALDSMNPHFANITRDRGRFLSWGLQANNASIRAGARRVSTGKSNSYSVYVRPHPYIRAGYRRARTKLSPLIKQKTKQVLRDV